MCLSSEIVIRGAGRDNTFIDGHAAGRVGFVSFGANVTISGVTIRNGLINTGSFNGGGAGLNNQGTLTVVDSEISANTSIIGSPGIYTIGGALTVRRTRFLNNTGVQNSGDGAGILLSSGTLVVSDSEFDGNTAGNGGGGISVFSGNLSVSGSTFSNNRAGWGGAIRVYYGQATVTNSTFYGNRSESVGSAIANEEFGTVTLNNVTIAGNATATNGGALATSVRPMYLENSIVAGNAAGFTNFGPDCVATAPASIELRGVNLIQDTRACNLTGETSKLLVGFNPGLGTLARNGGPTATLALLPTSPAVDAGPAGVPPFASGSCPAFDQRHVLRPQGARCDLGAFERDSGFRLSRITPNRGGANGSVTVIATGAGFTETTTVLLRRTGFANRAGSPVTIEPGGFSFSSSFDLTGLATGAWDVVVSSGEGSAILPSAFIVEAAQPPKLFSYVTGRSAIRIGIPARYQVVFGNRGNVDAYNVPLTLQTPGNFQLNLLFPVTPPPPQPGQVAVDPNEVPLAAFPWSPQTQLTVPLLIPVIPAGYTGTIEFNLVLPPNTPHGATFAFSAILGDPLSNPAPDPAALQSAVAGAVRYAQRDLSATVPASAIPAVQAYAATQLQLTIAEGQEQMVSSLGTRPAVFSLAQLSIELALFAASVSGTQKRAAAVEIFAAAAGTGSAPCKNKGQVLQEGTTGCREDHQEPVEPPKNPPPKVPKGITPQMCSDIPKHHLTADGAACVPDSREGCNGIGIPNPVLGPGDVDCNTYPVLNSLDPNEKYGPKRGKDITAQPSGNALAYRISFENVATTSGAAQTVTITDHLDASWLDVSTFSLGPMTFGRHTILPPPGLTSYTTIFDLRPEKAFLVRVMASLHAATATASWVFSTLDPSTGQPTEDPFAGLLPPNRNPPEGEGGVTFTIQPKLPVASGTAICNQASIVFDFNAPIVTNRWCNTIDDTPPLSRVAALPGQQASPTFTVRWDGSDVGSAIASFDVYASENGGAFTRWLERTSEKQAAYTGRSGARYAFFSVATDQAGNREAMKHTGEASTSTAAAVRCATDVTAEYNVVRGGFRRDSSGVWVQVVTVTRNNGAAMDPALRVVLTGVPTGMSLANASGQTSCLAPSGSPYVIAAPLGPGNATASSTLRFTNPANVPITYTLRLFAGSGQY